MTSLPYPSTRMIDYTRSQLNVWHRWVGRTIFLSALFHVTGYLVLFTKKGTLSTSVTHVPEGWITLSGLCMLAIFSMPQVRRSVYTLFWHCHWIGYCMMLIGVSPDILTCAPTFVTKEHLLRYPSMLSMHGTTPLPPRD